VDLSLSHDPQVLRARIDRLNPTVLLMCLVHMTGRTDMLDLYGPRMRTAAEAGQSDPDAIDKIRAAVVDRLVSGTEPKLQYPSDDLFRKMVDVCLGDMFGDETIPLLRDHVRFPGEPRKAPVTVPDEFEVLVIGAGMGGLAAGVELGEAGFRYRILEARSEVGGTWSVNRYPGAAVDTSSQHYSLSFALNSSWSRFYPQAPEYLAYLKDVAARFGIDKYVEYNTRAQSFEWDEEAQQWEVTALRNGEAVTYRANVVISAIGFLTNPIKPAFAGQDQFAGRIVHSAEWDDDLDLAGKKVLLVGTGCTGVQIVAAVSPDVEQLTIVQRQPNWVTPPGRVSMAVPDEQRWGLENVPFYVHWSRLSEQQNFSGIVNAIRVDPEWAATHDSVSPEGEAITERLRQYLQEKFADRPELIPLLTPDWPFFAKRPILDPGYFDALKRPNVELKPGTIDHYVEDAVVLSDGSVIPCDVVVLATGFTLEFMRHLHIRGRDGQTISDRFGLEPRAYWGINVPGFPNLFITCGPNSFPRTAGVGGGHNSVVEQQVHYAVESLRTLVTENIASIEVTEEATKEYNEGLDVELSQLVFQHAGNAHGYYRGATGRATFQMPYTFVTTRKVLTGPDLSKYIVTRRDDARDS
jgi:4-hydroxyacetophenone monooxygenase